MVNSGAPASNVAYLQVADPVIPSFTGFYYGFGGDEVGNSVPADLDDDGKLDLIVSYTIPFFHFLSLGSAVFLGNGDGTFQQVTNSVGQPSGGVVAVGDFNGDGKLDIFESIITDSYPSNYYVTQLGNGDGTFTIPPIPVPSASEHLLSLGISMGTGSLTLPALQPFLRVVVDFPSC